VTTVYLARHGESDWNAEGRWQGNADRPLTDRGRRQAEELAGRLASVPLDAVYSSDLRRARDTAEAVAAGQGLEVRALPALREVDVGSWSGLSRPEVEERFPEAFSRWRDGGQGWEDGETYERMTERVVAAVLEIAAAHPDGAVLVVAHGGPIRALHAVALGLDISEHRRLKPVAVNAKLSRLTIEDGRLVVDR
jgi:broad specificity phosphatase PhoE